MNYIVATAIALVLIGIVYTHSSWKAIKDCYSMWFDRQYWTNYNIVEGVSWLAKAIVIVPGLIFGIQVWWFYVLTLITSLALIWASNKKLLPTLVAFNTLWVWMSCIVIIQHFATPN